MYVLRRKSAKIYTTVPISIVEFIWRMSICNIARNVFWSESEEYIRITAYKKATHNFPVKASHHRQLQETGKGYQKLEVTSCHAVMDLKI